MPPHADDTLSEEEMYQLRRSKMLQGLQKELSDWGKKRFWAVVIVGTIVGVIGLNGVVIATLFTMLQTRIEEITVTSGRAADIAEMATTAADEIDASRAMLAQTIEELQGELELARHSRYEIRVHVKSAQERRARTDVPSESVSGDISRKLQNQGFQAEPWVVAIASTERTDVTGDATEQRKSTYTETVENMHYLSADKLQSEPAVIYTNDVPKDVIDKVHELAESVFGSGEVDLLNSRNNELWNRIDVYVPANLETL